MRPVEVSTADVLDAGRRLLDEGKKVNGWALRRAVGDRGKPERLAEVWQKAAEAGAEPAPSVEAVPTVLPPGIAEMADQARMALAAQFEAILQTVYRTTDEALKSRYKADFDRLSAERTQMEDDLTTASSSIEATEASLAEAVAEADGLRARLTEAETAAAVAAERLRALHAKAAADTAEAGARIGALDEQLRASGAAAQAAREKSVAAEATAAAVEREAKRLRMQVASLTGTLDAARADAAVAKASAESQRERAAAAEAALRQAREAPAPGPEAS